MTKPIQKSNAPDFEKHALNGSEDSHQICLFAKCAGPEIRAKYPELKWLFAIPNGGYRDKREAGKLKAMGVKCGVPDICLPIKRGEWGGLYIELKRPETRGRKKGTASQEQGGWIEHLRSQGYGAIICVGWQEAWKVIVEYLEYK